MKRLGDSFNPFIRLETLIGSDVAPALPTHCLHTHTDYILPAQTLYTRSHIDNVMCPYSTPVAR